MKSEASGVQTAYSSRLDHHLVGNGCVLDHDDDAVLYDEAEIFSVALHNMISIDDLHIATDAGIFIDDGAPDC